MRMLTFLAILAISTVSFADEGSPQAQQVFDHFVGTWDIECTVELPGGESFKNQIVSHRSVSRSGFLVFDDPDGPLQITMSYDSQEDCYKGVMLVGTTRSSVYAMWNDKSQTMYFEITNHDDETIYRGNHRFIKDGYAEAWGRITSSDNELVMDLSYEQTRRSKE